MNIKEIAKKANVSVATVSRVLNHPDSVAEKTRMHILKVMEESEYTPNWFARGLNSKKTFTIGLVVPNILNPAYTEIIKGIEDVAQQKGYTAFLCNSEDNQEKEKKYIDALITRQVDGIVLVYPVISNEDIEDIENRGIPVVIVGDSARGEEGPMVRIDCSAATVNAMRYIMERGHNKIGMIYGETPLYENKKKLDGYEKALAEAHIPILEEYKCEAENTVEGGYLAAKKMLGYAIRPSAIFTSSDLLAFGVIEAALDLDLRIPEDLALVGFDDIRMTRLIQPRLTTIAKPLHRMGMVAARLLMDIMESEDNGKTLFRNVSLQSKLKIRKTCGHSGQIEEMF